MSIKTVGFKFSTDKEYIYESPDGGQTIYRREFGNYDNKEKIIEHTPSTIDCITEPDGMEIGTYSEEHIKEKAPMISEMMGEVNKEPSLSEIDILKQRVLSLEMTNAELKDMLRQQGVDVL